MAQKPAVQNEPVNHETGMMTQDSMIFKPFDEIWNPGFMPLDMVFQNIQESVKGSIIQKPGMGRDRPQGSGPTPMAPSVTGPSQGANGSVNLVLLYAPWCGHSKNMLPDYERVKSEFDGKVINGKKVSITMYDSDIDKDKVKEYGVKGFPTLFIEKDGQKEPFPHRSYDKIAGYLNNL
jgi:thiol-disulfide isomerase/thioredoxin